MFLNTQMHPKKANLCHSESNSSVCYHKGASDHQCFRLPTGGLKPFHALEDLPDSSSWFDQVPNFRQEIRQSHYRNDPVKYDLS
jgi:hypothetical protein